MAFQIVRQDLTTMKVDVIVNAANPRPVISRGVDSAVHKAAGYRLLEARKRVGDIAYGDAVMTSAYLLSAKYVVHTVSPVWKDGLHDEKTLLMRCYRRSLELAYSRACKSIAFPLLTAGDNGFPKDIALQAAIQSISAFLMGHEMQVYLAVFDSSAYALSEKLFQSVQSFIDDNYILKKSLEAQPMSTAPSRKLEELIQEVDETFSEHLIRLIDQKGFKDPDVYKMANIDRKHFSKIKNTKDYRPSKSTALALAISLRLSLDETKDLISRAGYALTHSSKFDIIIEYFLQEKNYNIFEINEVLFAFDQPLVGG